jgi:hypothetical protein
MCELLICCILIAFYNVDFFVSNLEKIVRERFGKAVARGVNDLNIKRATHSPISGLIDNAVIEVKSIVV